MTRASRDLALHAAWKAGDGTARGKLIANLLDVARKVTWGFARDQQHFDDLFGEACIGLCAAVDSWEPGGTPIAKFAAVVTRNRLISHTKRAQPDTIAIHCCVTETIEEWKNSGDQEEHALAGEIATIARRALRPPDLKIIMRRSVGADMHELIRAMRMPRQTVQRHESTAMQRLAEAVADDGWD